MFLNLFLSIIEKESTEINKAAEAMVTCCNTDCARWDYPKFECFFCKDSLHEKCFEDEMLCSKSCAPKYRTQMVEPCAACQQLVNGDYKCMICTFIYYVLPPQKRAATNKVAICVKDLYSATIHQPNKSSHLLQI